jgi:hypothetical protein
LFSLIPVEVAVLLKGTCIVPAFLTLYVIVNKVPGNFHVSAHPFQYVLPKVLVYSGVSTLDLSHRINHLSFGNSIGTVGFQVSAKLRCNSALSANRTYSG